MTKERRFALAVVTLLGAMLGALGLVFSLAAQTHGRSAPRRVDGMVPAREDAPLGGGTTDAPTVGGATSGTASGGAGLDQNNPRVSLSVYSGPGQLEVTFAGPAVASFSIAVDGKTTRSHVHPGKQMTLGGLSYGVHTVTLLLRDSRGVHQLSRQADAYATRTIDEPTAEGGATFRVPVAGAHTAPGAQPVYDYLGTSSDGEQTHELTFSSTPPSPAGGWSWKPLGPEWTAAPQRLPGFNLRLQEWRDAAGRYRYIPAGAQVPQPDGLGWVLTGFSLYVCG